MKGEEIIFKIDRDKNGSEVSLNTLSVETASVLQEFLASLTELANLQENPAGVVISVRSGSVTTAVQMPEASNLIDTSNRAERAILKKIQKRIKQNGATYSVHVSKNGHSKDITDVFKKKKFVLSRRRQSEWKQEVLFKKGNINTVGGSKTNLHLQNDEETIVIDCTKEQARRYRAYDEVFVSVLKQSKPDTRPTYQLIDFYTNEEDYNGFYFLYNNSMKAKGFQRYDMLHDFIVHNFPDNIISINKLMKLFNHANADRGLVKTILMSTKPILSVDNNMNALYDKLSSHMRLESK